MIETNDLRPGVCFEYDNEYWQVIEYQHVKPGKGPAFVRVRIKNLRKGSVVERTFRTSEKVEQLRVETRPSQYLYSSVDTYVFMDNESYEQSEIPASAIEDISGYLVENMNVNLITCKGEILSIEMPASVETIVVKTDPGVKGDTAQGGSKPATIEGGAVVQVPLFINEGDKIKVDTKEGRYIERVK